MRISQAQADALSERLGLPVRVAGRLWSPYPSEVIERLYNSGIRTLVSLPLAPQSVHVYHAPVREAAAKKPDLRLIEAPPWGEEPALIDAFLARIDEALGALPPAERAAVPVILSAHSLPQRVIDAGDAYEREFRAMAGVVQERLGARGTSTYVAFQSQGMTSDGGGAWLGPDLPTTFARVAEEGHTRALVAPIGFVADHIETLYDLDIEAQELARRAGLTSLLRAPAPNDHPLFIDALSAVVKRALAA